MRTYEAIQLAIRAHNNQYRKLDGDIYVAHPLEVGIILASNSYDTDIIIAGILHDTVEDTFVSLEDIGTQFGERVKNLVSGCSEKDKSLNWKERKIHALAAVENSLDPGVKVVFCADKLSNIKSILRYRECNPHMDLWSKFNAGFEEQKWYYTESLKILACLNGTKMYQDLKCTIDLVFFSK